MNGNFMLSFTYIHFIFSQIRLEPYSHGLILCKRIGCIEIFTGARAFDDFLDDRLNLVPIFCWKGSHPDVEILLDVLNHTFALWSADQTDGDTNSSKPTRTANSMEVCLRVGVAGVMLLGKILVYV